MSNYISEFDYLKEMIEKGDSPVEVLEFVRDVALFPSEYEQLKPLVNFGYRDTYGLNASIELDLRLRQAVIEPVVVDPDRHVVSF